MVSKFRFDGRVAVVTGAARGLGRSYAALLADRGAKVVVNDLGTSSAGEGSDVAPAQRAAEEIAAAGGEAVADSNDVSTPEGGKAIIDTAIETFGRIDIVVNNAGMVDFGAFPEIELANLEKHVAIHLYGSFNTTKAAWPHFVDQGYGRVVLTASTGMFGMKQNLSYAIVKSAMIGFANSATISAAPYDIKINTIFPNGFTRLGGLDESKQSPEDSQIPTRLVAPMVGYMSHESFPRSGELLIAGGRRFGRIFVGMTQGWLKPGAPTIEDVASHWDEITDEGDYYVPDTLSDASYFFFRHQENHMRTTDDDIANRVVSVAKKQ
jgi:NAD(P)-dependent dehydrogenase (short-subunit alcohol dehydrogenase family)